MKFIFILLIAISCKPKDRPSVNTEANGDVKVQPTVITQQCDIKPNEQKWEVMQGETIVHRLKVCGGWLVKPSHDRKSMFTFIPDENHVW